jgi:hypothetical protein
MPTSAIGKLLREVERTMSKKKTLAEEMYEQESKDIENAINTLNKTAAEKGDVDNAVVSEIAEQRVDQKAVILEYLKNAYSGAKMLDDVEMMCRLSRAILAFDYDDLEKHPTWEEMQEAYMCK